ncbi:MAG: type II secretion system GspH family protein [Candidatus Gastranaerophilales bacterium]|nr:type II secretion system GspH family protein [Candidatus Gastranaerophilales bacterium]
MYKFKKAFTLAEGAMHVAMESFMHRRLCINGISTKIGSILPRPTEDSKAGFTLAEVLITLGIIGVVAAITIPGLLTRSEQNVTVTKLERAISVLNKAYKYVSYKHLTLPTTSRV